MKKIKTKIIAGIFVCGLTLTGVMTNKMITTIASADETSQSIAAEVPTATTDTTAETVDDKEFVPATLAYFIRKAEQGDEGIFDIMKHYDEDQISDNALVLIMDGDPETDNYAIYTDGNGIGDPIQCYNYADPESKWEIPVLDDPNSVRLGEIREALAAHR